MTFLNPAYLFGLFAAALPVIIHFLNLRKLKTIEFSTLKFLKEIQKTKVRNLKIKQWLLLAIRVLIIIFIVLAFSRPTIKRFNILGSNGFSKTSAVIIIDNSISMSAKDPKGNAFNEAKDFAVNLLKYFQNGDEVLALPTSLENDNGLNSFTNVKSAEVELEKMRVSFISYDLSTSFKKAIDILKTSSNANKEIYILSDLQKGKFFNEKISLKDFSKLNIKVFLVDFKKEIKRNLSAVDFAINNQILEKNILLNYTSQIQNGKSDLANGIASLFINMEKISQVSVNLSSGEKREVNQEYLLNRSGLIESTFELEDDDLDLDNKRYHSIYIPDKISVLCVADEPESVKYIKLVLASASENIMFEIMNPKLISSKNLSLYDLVVLVGNPKMSSAELRKVIPPNKSLMIFPAYNSAKNEFDQVLAAFDLGRSMPINSESFVEFEKLEMQHPILNNLFEGNKIKNVESPQIRKYVRINPANSLQSVISLQDNYPFLLEKKTNQNKIFLFSISPDLSNSDFPLKGIFAPLILKSVYYLANQNKSLQKYFPGDEISFELPQDVEYLDIIKPDGVEEHIKNDSMKMFKYKNTDLIGCYKFYANKKLINFVDVNIDSTECNYSYFTLSEAVKYLQKKNVLATIIPIQNKANADFVITQARLGSELWKYLIAIALLLLLLEMLIARNSKKEISLVTKYD